MADVTVDEVKAVLTAEIGNLTAQMKRAADSIEAIGKTATKSFGEANKSFSTTGAKAIELNQALELVGKGWEFLKDTIGEAVKQAIDEQSAIAQLNATLQSSGRFTEGLSSALQGLAEDFQRTTTFSNDQALSVERLLIQYGAAPADIQPFTQAILDAAAGGKDLDTVASAVAGAFSGKFGPAARLLKIQLDESASSTENLAKVQQALTEQYGGRATAALNTFGGGLKNAKNLYDDLLKSIGKSIIESPALIQALQDIRRELDSPEAKEFAKTIGVDLANGIKVGVGAIREGIAVFHEAEGALKGLALGAGALYLALYGIPKLLTLIVEGLTLIVEHPAVATILAITAAAETAAKKIDDLHAEIAKGAEAQGGFDQLAEGIRRAGEAGIPFTQAMRAAVLSGKDVNVVLHEAAFGAKATGEALDPLADKTRKFADALSQAAQHAITQFRNEVKGIGVESEALGPLFDDTGARLDLFTKGLSSMTKEGVPAARALGEVRGALGEFQDLLLRDIASKIDIGLKQAGLSALVFGRNFDVAGESASAVNTELDRLIEKMAAFAAKGKEIPKEFAEQFLVLSRTVQNLGLDSAAAQMSALETANATLGKSFETAGGQAGVLEKAIADLEHQAQALETALAGATTPQIAEGLQAQLEKTLATAQSLQPQLVAALGTDVANGIATSTRDLNIQLDTLLKENTAVFKTEADQRIGIAALEADAETAKARDGVERRIDLMIQERQAAGQGFDDLIAARARIEDQITAVAQEAKDKRIAIAQAEVEAERKAFANIGPDLARGFADGIDKMIFDGGKLKDLFSSLKDFGVHEFEKLFEKTIENKLGILDSGFRTNLLTDIPSMFSSMAGNVLGIFGKLWDGILGGKEAGLDQPLSQLLGGGGAGGAGNTAGNVLNTVGGAQKLLGLIGQTGVLGNAGTGALGNLSTIASFAGAGGSFAGPTTALSAQEAQLLFPRGQVPGNFTTSGTSLQGSFSSLANGLSGLLGAVALVHGAMTLFAKNASTGQRVLAGGEAVLGGSAVSGALGGPTITSIIAPYLTQLAANVGVQVGTQVGTQAATQAGAQIATRVGAQAAAPALGGASAGAVSGYAGAVIGAIQLIRALSGSSVGGSQNKGQAVVNAFDPYAGGSAKTLALDLFAGAALGQLIGKITGINGLVPGTNVLSRGQTSRRFLGNEVLGGTTSIGGLGPTLNFDPYKSGVTSIQKAAEAYPELFAKAGKAAEFFGTVLAASVKSGQNNAKETNYIVSTLLDNLGRAGKGGAEGLVRVAAAMRELGIDAKQAGEAVANDLSLKIDQAIKAGNTPLADALKVQLSDALTGLSDIASVSAKQIVSTLQAGLSDKGKALFDRLVKSGADSFQAVTAASNEAFQSIAAGLSGQLLPAAAATFELLKSLGISSADAIKEAFAGLSELGASFPSGNSGAPSFFQTGGKLAFGSFQNGAFVPAPAPETTPQQQRDLRNTVPKFATGGIVPGAIGAPVLAMVHGGETVLPTHDPGALGDFMKGGFKMPSFDIGGIVPGTIGAATLATVHGGETIIPTHTPSGIGNFAEQLANAYQGRAPRERGTSNAELAVLIAREVEKIGHKIIVQPVLATDQLPGWIYRNQREGRLIQPQTQRDKPVGIL